MLSPLLVLFGFVAWAATAWAKGTFLFPEGPDGANIFNLGQTINITWTGMSDYPVFSLGVEQATNQTESWLIGNSEDHPTRYEWTVNVDQMGFDLNDSRLFSFYACNGSDATGNAFSLPFGTNRFIVRDQDTSSSSTTTSVSVTQSTQTASATPTESATDPAAASHTSSGLSTGAKAGIGIGIALVVVLVVGAIARFLLRKKEPKHTIKPTGLSEMGPTNHDFNGHVYRAQLHADSLQRPPAELDGFAASRYRTGMHYMNVILFLLAFTLGLPWTLVIDEPARKFISSRTSDTKILDQMTTCITEATTP